jgi:hypothetical protein
MLSSAGQRLAFFCPADDVAAVASERQLACRYPSCDKIMKRDLRAHVGVHMSTDPNLAMCGFCCGLSRCTAVLNRNGQAQLCRCQHGC